MGESLKILFKNVKSVITTFSVGGFCNDTKPSLNLSCTSRSRVVAIICRLTDIPLLSASKHRSSIRIVSPHPSRAAAACRTAGSGTLDDMADTRCCHCCVPASRPAQATTMKMSRETEEERQRQPRSFTHAIIGRYPSTM